MVARLDHISVLAPTLAGGSAFVEAALGVVPLVGRSHPSMATHNLLLALGSDVYLEVISADPSVAAASRPRWFGLDQVLPGSPARLGAWVARTDDIIGAIVPELGEVESMRRDAHSWQMAIRADGTVPLEGAAPLLIQRALGTDPVAMLPRNDLQFKRLLIEHPMPDRVFAIFGKIGLQSHPRVSVVLGDHCNLVAEIETPGGTRRLGAV